VRFFVFAINCVTNPATKENTAPYIAVKMAKPVVGSA
jgi:hypothetical protein